MWVALLLLAGCPERVSGGARAVVSFSRLAPGPACIRVAATDTETLGALITLRSSTDVSISDLGAMGQIVVGVGRGTDWSNEMEIRASLFIGGCTNGTPNTTDSVRLTLEENELPTVTLALNQAPPDAGAGDGGLTDAGPRPDAGADAGSDAGPFDSGVVDGGAIDSGAGPGDAGMPDAGPFDAGGIDAGVFDAGPSCSGAFVGLPSPLNNTFYDVAMFDSNIAMLSGQNGNLYAIISDGGTERWSDVKCIGELKAIWVKGRTQVFVASNVGQLQRFNSAGNCTPGIATLASGQPTSMATYGLGTTTRLWVGATAPPGITKLEINDQGGAVGTPGTYAPMSGLPNNDSQVLDMAGTSDTNVYAVGYGSNGKGFILKFDPAMDEWRALDLKDNTIGHLQAIGFASPTSGFAGGQEFLVYDGTKWTKSAKPNFEIFGLKVFSPTSVLAVGSEANGVYGIAIWNGVAWSQVGAVSHPGGANLSHVDGTSVCDAWAVGPLSAIVTSNDRP